MEDIGTGSNNGKKRKLHEMKDYNDFTKEELIFRVKQLEKHVFQLRNIISKQDDNQQVKKKREQKPFDFRRYNTRHVALRFVYLGWDYHGFVIQEDSEKTIENYLFEALLILKLIESRETSNYHRCGRTDKGVSAFGQVISIDLRTNLLEGVGVKVREDGTASSRSGDCTTEIDYVKIINKLLPKEIRVLAWAPVPEDFSARFSCIRRTYKYYFPKGHLNVDVMYKASQKLLGEHDFRNLCKMDVNNGVVEYIRNIASTDLKVFESADGYNMCELTVAGKAFLWHQIRCIVGVLILVGQGKEDPSIIDELLDIEKHPRKPQYNMASYIPLVLFDCQYEDVEWIYSEESHINNIKHLQDMWSQNSIKTTMIKRMLDSLGEKQIQNSSGTIPCPKLPIQSNWLIDIKDSKHIPLLTRPTSESLEEKVKSAKMRKLQN
ncbi:hypothetical protein LOTGIDRAFT_105384 [Lottia gigantea]|uniref:Pseudouridine synthase I TruA alpha/beta domain-containing protein n=2 Tax=Lottia gigantea TaxID=225164 RepID=V4BR98_LOTGI|nr:hypothetical protein LOTGIDRAFT_105384 [Lottia gigantea]ESO91369.1 hypothetical protein LOTGIDRAFT_105384 [Lottia gigantea]